MSEFWTFSGTKRTEQRSKTAHNPCVVDRQLTGKVIATSKEIYQDSVTAKNPMRNFHRIALQIAKSYIPM